MEVAEKRDVRLREFIKYFIQSSVCAGSGELSLNDFWEKVYSEVSEYFSMSRKEVFDLHHPFHWMFFNSGNSSPFHLGERDLEDSVGGEFFVNLDDYDFAKRVSEMPDEIYREYEIYLRDRYSFS